MSSQLTPMQYFIVWGKHMPKEMIQRQEQEKELENKYLNQVVSYLQPKRGTLIGKINRISFWPKDGQEVVTFEIGNKNHESDLDYFEENCTIL